MVRLQALRICVLYDKINVIILTHAVAYDESVNYNACKSVINTDIY